MTFGEIKSIIEKNLLESYQDPKHFKKMLKEFRYYVLDNKQLSQLYTLYDQLNSPQGLNEEDAKEFLNEGVNLIRDLIFKLKLPIVEGFVDNEYKYIDSLVYSNKMDISERIESKKHILKTLMTENKKYTSQVNLPLESMVKVANQTINSYISDLDEDNKKAFFEIVSEDTEKLKTNYQKLKESAVDKLNRILEKESEIETKGKILETINKIEGEDYDVIRYVKLKSLVESL